MLQQTKEGSNSPFNNFHRKHGADASSAYSDYGSASVLSLDEKDDKFRSECSNKFETCFKK